MPTIDAKRQSLGDILGRYERRPVKLPPFQRSYSWETSHVATFASDLIAFSESYSKNPVTANYYLGSIVVIPSDTEITVLDGQQRLATATVALAAIRDAARALDSGGETKGAFLAQSIQRELIERDTDPISYSLTLGDLDEPYFLKAIKQNPAAAPTTRLRSHRRIFSAHSELSERLTKLLKGKTYDEKLSLLKLVQDSLVKGMTLVSIEVQDEDAAFQIFETLNDRGLRLSVPDLVLNLLMRRAGSSSNRRVVRQKWNEMLKEMGRRDIGRFMRHMWVSMFGDLKEKGLYAAIREHLEAQKLTSIDFAQLCADECEAYVEILDVDVSGLGRDGESELEGAVRYLSITPALPLLLSGYRCLERSHLKKLISEVVRLFVRYVLVGNQNPLDVETCFYSAAREIRARKEGGSDSATALKNGLTKLKPLAIDDATVGGAAENLELERNQAIYIVNRVANVHQSQTKELAMDKTNLEHIFPQNADNAWPNRDNLEPFTWHVGNLTVMGERLNRNAKNKSFSDKCRDYYKKSEVRLTRDILKHGRWNEKELKGRAKQMAKLLVRAWPNR